MKFWSSGVLKCIVCCFFLLFTKMSLSLLFLLRFASFLLLCHVTNYFNFCIIKPRPRAEKLFQVWVGCLGSNMNFRRKFDNRFLLSFLVIFGAWSWNRLASDGIWKISIPLIRELINSMEQRSKQDKEVRDFYTTPHPNTPLHSDVLALSLKTTAWLPTWLTDCQTNWPTDRLADRLTDWLTTCLPVWLID